MSQSPQTGQFNSYEHIMFIYIILCLISLNPLKRVNSILTASCYLEFIEPWTMSQSPQTGQFNSYEIASISSLILIVLGSQSPQTGQFNSYVSKGWKIAKRTDGTKVSIPSNGSIQFLLLSSH